MIKVEYVIEKRSNDEPPFHLEVADFRVVKVFGFVVYKKRISEWRIY